MARYCLAVFDYSEDYVSRFIGFIKKKYGYFMDVIGFTDRKALREYLKTHRVQILLYSQEKIVDEIDANDRECDEFINNENVEEFIYLGEKRKNNLGLNYINKYQSAENIVGELSGYLRESVAEYKAEDSGIKVILVYSPGHEDILLSSINIAKSIGEEEKVLYINLERFSQIKKEQGRENQKNISNVIYYFKSDKTKLKEALQNNRIKYMGLDVLTSPFKMEDLDEIGKGEWKTFLEEAARAGGYEYVVLDVQEAIRNLEEIIGIANEIYVPVSMKKQGSLCYRQFICYLNKVGRSDLQDKIIKVMLNEEK